MLYIFHHSKTPVKKLDLIAQISNAMLYMLLYHKTIK